MPPPFRSNGTASSGRYCNPVKQAVRSRTTRTKTRSQTSSTGVILRGHLVALARAGELLHDTINTAVARVPRLREAADYLRDEYPSVLDRRTRESLSSTDSSRG